MSFVYFASFDLRRILPGALVLGTPGKPTISLNLNTFTSVNQFATSCTVFNHLISSTSHLGFDRERSQTLRAMPTLTFGAAISLALRDLADDAGWIDTSSLALGMSTLSRSMSIVYAEGIELVSFASTAGRRLFGFASDTYSGPPLTVIAGTEQASYVITSTLDGPSSITPILEDEPMASAAYSGEGRCYGLTRTGTVLRRRWVQQYEPKAKTFRRSAAAAPNEYTFQSLYEDCRAGLPFAAVNVPDGAIDAYTFDVDQDSFHPVAATPGNANQYHIPFNCIALGTDA